MQEFGCGRGVGSRERDADAGRDEDQLVVEDGERGQKRVTETLRHCRGGFFGGGITQEDDELVAAEARQEIAWAQRVAQARDDGGQHRIARTVAEAVIDLLEPVQVEKQQPTGHAADVRARDSSDIDRLEKPFVYRFCRVLRFLSAYIALSAAVKTASSLTVSLSI